MDVCTTHNDYGLRITMTIGGWVFYNGMLAAQELELLYVDVEFSVEQSSVSQVERL
jgi:hypothetical protein